MKTKEEILRHLSKRGYREEDVRKIAGFLVGAKITKVGELVNYKDGSGSFEDFLKWYECIPETNVFGDIATNLDYLTGFASASHKLPENIANRTKENIQFLMDNKEFLHDCMKKKAEAEAFLDDVEEVMEGINKTMESLLKR